MDVADELQIRNLIARVARLVDKPVPSSVYAEEWTQDCILQFASEAQPPYRGRDGIMRRRDEVGAISRSGPVVTMRHLVGSLEVVGDAADPQAATAHSFVVILSLTDASGPKVVAYGEYDDVLRREDGRWRIASRKVSGFGSSRPPPDQTGA